MNKEYHFKLKAPLVHLPSEWCETYSASEEERMAQIDEDLHRCGISMQDVEITVG